MTKEEKELRKTLIKKLISISKVYKGSKLKYKDHLFCEWPDLVLYRPRNAYVGAIVIARVHSYTIDEQTWTELK